MKLIAAIVLFVLVPLACLPAIGLQERGQPAMTESEMIAALKRFESMFFGLRFKVSMNTGNFSRRIDVDFSDSGDFLRVVQRSTTRGSTLTTAQFFNQPRGWVLYANENADEPGIKANCRLSFAMKGLQPLGMESGFIELASGYINSVGLSEFCRQSVCRVTNCERNGSTYICLECDHPGRGDVTFGFEEDRMVWAVIKRRNGDMIGGSRSVSPTIVTGEAIATGRGVETTFFPVEYGDFEGRTVLSAIGVSIGGVPNSNVEYRFEGYQNSNLTSRVDLVGTGLDIADGEPIHCTDEPDAVYALRNGEIVRLVDSTAIRNAERARMYRRGAWTWRYVGYGLVVTVIILAILAKRKMRRAA